MMDELLVKYLAEEATPPERARVEAWIGEDEANLHYFNHFKTIWERAAGLAPVVPIDENEAWKRFQRRVKVVPARRKNAWMRIAALFILVIGAGILSMVLLKEKNDKPQQLALNATDRVMTDTLPDGTVATLNKHSELSFPSSFRGKQRKVNLEGEAFFAVKPDKEHPFVIDVNGVEVTVLGTSFNVRSTADSTEVIVETGRVQVKKDSVVILLQAGERVIFGKADPAPEKKQSSDKLYNYYISRTFVCDNTPLWKLVEKLNTAYDVNIVITRKELRNLPLNVTFDEESLDMILKVISQTLMVKITREENRIEIH
jgi:transmembrane sensor